MCGLLKSDCCRFSAENSSTIFETLCPAVGTGPVLFSYYLIFLSLAILSLASLGETELNDSVFYQWRFPDVTCMKHICIWKTDIPEDTLV
jgi:hypothetical protein